MLEQIEILEKARLYKKADAILRKVISEEREYAPQIETDEEAIQNTQQSFSPDVTTKLYTAYRPLAVYLNQKYAIDLFALPKNLNTLIKATQTGTTLPDEALKFPQVFYKDIQAIQGVEDFLKNYPNLYKDLTNINSQIKFLKNQNYWQWLGGIKDSNQFKQELQNLNGLKNFATDFYKSQNKILNLAELSADEIKNIKSGFESSKVLNRFNERMINFLIKNNPNQHYSVDSLKKYTNNELVEAIENTIKAKPLQDQQKYSTFLQTLKDSAKNEEFATKLIANAEKAGNITKASTEGTEAAASIAKKFPMLNKILGPLGILLSLPAAYKWTKKIIAGEEFTNEEIVEFIQDMLNLFSAVAFMIPGGQLVSAVLGGLSLTIMGGSYIAKQFEAKEEPKEKQERDISSLMEQATPGNFSDFNDWLNSKNMDYSSMKIIDILKALEVWIPQSQFAKEYDWFVNPTEQNKNKIETFKQKYLQLWNTYQKGGNVSNLNNNLAFNSLEDVKKTYDKQYSQNPYIGFAFRQNKPLKEIISTIQKEMAPSMPQGQKWFAEVPLNYSDKDLLKWYNSKYPNGFLTASTSKITRVATSFNLKKYTASQKKL